MTNTMLHQTALTQHQARAVQTIDRYWHQLAAGSVLPRRSQIDPRLIQDALEYTFIAERISGGHARFRVAGGSVSGVLGMDVPGMPLAVLVSPEARTRFADEVAHLFDAPCKLGLTMQAPAAFGQPALEAHLRLYPLLGSAGGVTQMIGTFVTTGHIGRTPRRFGIVTAEASPVSQPTALRQMPIRTRGHLTLVISND